MMAIAFALIAALGGAAGHAALRVPLPLPRAANA